MRITDLSSLRPTLRDRIGALRRRLARTSDGLGQRLPLWLATQTFTGLALISLAVYLLTAADLEERQREVLDGNRALIAHVLNEAARSTASGVPASADRSEVIETTNEPALRRRLDEFFDLHRDVRLRLTRLDGGVLYDNLGRADLSAKGLRIERFEAGAGLAPATLVLDARADAAFVRRLGMTLMIASLAGALLVSLGGFLLVRLALRPVRRLVDQTRRLAAPNLHHRLDADGLPDELLPLVDQFNALLERLRRSYAQLEGFNADVAHELRTPLATLITGTELSMREPGIPDATMDRLGSNLEELRRMAGIVSDMLFLSHAHSGARARRQPVESLAALARDVADYHEASIAEAGLALGVDGEAAGEFDAALLKRALSNLIGNATRYGTPGSTIRVCIDADGPGVVRLTVANQGPTIPPDHLPRLFDRFYRGDPARSRVTDNHGLGLSIVAAIARMHDGTPFARSDADRTRIGLTLTGARLPAPMPMSRPSRVRRRQLHFRARH
ncbi:hypothetical protein CDN99_07825 [Roseateles aquatilis]|uniref:Sensor protein n=1 Tax=Roseateles aquatilis TaxID=431061 RepID=A0A246JHV0_9BURK|nr:heavy metal sensor histidine kinase [Roseateles aquatilis]OWQ92238.1 hypothetical protein CDN99_07825 [Roseateles aquatilis]